MRTTAIAPRAGSEWVQALAPQPPLFPHLSLPVLPWHFRTSTARTPLNLLPGRPHLYAGLCHRRRELAQCGDHVEGTAADRGRLIHRRVAAVVLALGLRQDRSASCALMDRPVHRKQDGLSSGGAGNELHA